MSTEHLGTRIRAIRKRQGLTLGELGARINVRDNTLSRWETGHRRMSAERVEQVAAALGVPVSELYGEDGSAGD